MRIVDMPCNETMKDMVDLETGVVFAQPDGEALAMQILRPMWKPEGKGFPLVVFIQGSGWTKPDQFWQLPQLSLLAHRGFVVASVDHRSCETAPAPAFLVDAKAALRYLRAHAAEYDIDETRVCAWGTSSGGNTALLMGLTGDDPAYESSEWPGVSTKVQAVVDCFGPTDMPRLIEAKMDVADEGMKQTVRALSGYAGPDFSNALPEEIMERMRSISPVEFVRPGMALPPFLLLQGDADDVVPYDQTEWMTQKLESCGYEAEMIRVHGAPHEGAFWSLPLMERIFDFIERTIG